MDLCPILLYLVVILAIVAVVGHGLWVLIAAIFRAVFGPDHHPYRSEERHRQSEPRRRGRQLCLACGSHFSRVEERCPECGFHVDDPRAHELSELEKTREYLQSLVDKGTLDGELGSNVLRNLAAHHHKLIAGRGRVRADSDDLPIRAGSVSDGHAEAAGPVADLEALLADCRDVKELSVQRRKQVLETYRQLDGRELPQLSARTLLALARIVRMAALSTRALDVYRLLLVTYPHAVESAQAAFEGGMYAAHEQKGQLAVWFLERALVRKLPEHDRQAAADLLGRLRPEEAPARAARPAAPVPAAPADLPSAIILPDDAAPERPPVPGGGRETPAAEPSRSFGQMLAGFMEERNILWGELVGGLLIVGCSIALVISLWQTLEAIPYFPFLIFAALTFAMFGAGLYTLNHWKLESTSRGLLAIAVLLTPLSFLILAGLWRGQDADVVGWLIEGVGLLAFTFLVWRSGRILTAPLSLQTREPDAQELEAQARDSAHEAEAQARDSTHEPEAQARDSTHEPEAQARDSADQGNPLLAPRAQGNPLLALRAQGNPLLALRAQSVGAALLVLAVVGSAASQLLVPHLLDPHHVDGTLFSLIAFVPGVCFALALAPVLLWLSWRQRMDGNAAKALFLFLGLGAFAVGLTLGFLVNWSLDAGTSLQMTLAGIAFPLALAGAPLVVSGSLLNLLLDKEETSPTPAGEGMPLGLVRVIGTCIGLGGMAVMIAAMIVAWSSPSHAMGIGFLNCAAFVLVALRYRLPYAQVPALISLSVAYLLAFCLATGTLGGQDMLTLKLATAPENGPALAILAALLAAGSEVLARIGRTLDGVCHVVGAALLGVIGMGLTYQAGLTEPLRAAWVSAWCGVGALLVNLRWRHPAITYGAAAGLMAACGFLTHWHDPNLFVPQVALLAFASGMTVLYLVIERFEYIRSAEGLIDNWPQAAYVTPMRLLALFASTAAVVPMLLFLQREQWAQSCGHAFWLAGIWLVISWKERWPGWFAACQLAVTAGVLLAATDVLWQMPWVERRSRDLGHLWSLQVYLLALAGLSLFWLAVRFALGKYERARLLLMPRIKLEPPADAPASGEEKREAVHIELAVDREVFNGITLLQFLLAGFAVLPHVVKELTPAGVQHAEWVPLNLPLAWSVLGLLTLGWLATLWGWRAREAVFALLILTLTVPVLAADWFRDQLATASALRWGLGLCWLACSALLWGRGGLAQISRILRMRVPDSHARPQAADMTVACRVLLLAISVVPVLLITGVVAQMGFMGATPAGPDAASFFARLGWVTNMIVPLALVGVGLFGHGVREDLAGYIFSAGLVLLVSVTGGHALGIVVAGGVLDQAAGVFILQLGAIAAGGWGIAWLLSRRWWSPGLLSVQAVLALLPMSIHLCVCLGTIVDHPAIRVEEPAANEPAAQARVVPAFLLKTGQAPGWLGLLAGLTLAFWIVHKIDARRRVDVLAGGGILLGIITACLLAGFDHQGWLAYHVLIVAGALLGATLLSGSWIAGRASQIGPRSCPAVRREGLAQLMKHLLPAGQTQVWVDLISAGVVLLAVRAAWEDPGRPYWSCLATLAISILVGARAVWTRQPVFVYISGLLLNLAGYLAWQAWLIDKFGVRAWFIPGRGVVDTFLLVQIICLAAGSALWSLIDWRLRLKIPPVDVRRGFMPFAHAAVLLALHVLALLVLIGVGSDVFRLEVELTPALAWSALAATFVALALCWWDNEASLWGLPAGPMYVLGLTALGLALHETVAPAARTVGWHAALWLGAYLLAVNGFMRLVPRLGGLWHGLRLPVRGQQGLLSGWYWPVQGCIALFVLCLSVWICLDFAAVAARLAGPLAVGLIGAAAVLAIPFCPQQEAEPAQRRRTTAAELAPRTVRFVVLSLAIVLCIEAGWALLDQELPLLWLHRNVLVLAVLTCAAGLFCFRAVPGGGGWKECAGLMGPIVGVLSGVMLAEVLIQEFLQYDRELGMTPLARPAYYTVLALMLGVLIGCLYVAASKRNPLALTEKNKTRCVWAAEFLAVLLFVHTRLGLPRDFFHPLLREYWVFIVMALGFVGVGLAELLRRRGLKVLADPLHQTGVFLPLLPLIVFLVRTPVMQLHFLTDEFPGLLPFFRYFENLPQGPNVHAALWFLLCLLYACVAVLRRTSGFALLAALAANFGLWVIYAHHEPLNFFIHPQVWLVPLGLIILAAEHVNRPHLTHGQSLAVRYVGLLLIYISSSADMFIAGLGSVEYAIVVAVFSVAGVLTGILLRVRAFLFLGVAFLFLVILAQIWHAAVDLQHTWVWWACGIVLGAAILTLFALFEKRRNDLVKMIDELRHWK